MYPTQSNIDPFAQLNTNAYQARRQKRWHLGGPAADLLGRISQGFGAKAQARDAMVGKAVQQTISGVIDNALEAQRMQTRAATAHDFISQYRDVDEEGKPRTGMFTADEVGRIPSLHTIFSAPNTSVVQQHGHSDVARKELADERAAHAQTKSEFGAKLDDLQKQFDEYKAANPPAGGTPPAAPAAPAAPASTSSTTSSTVKPVIQTPPAEGIEEANEEGREEAKPGRARTIINKAVSNVAGGLAVAGAEALTEGGATPAAPLIERGTAAATEAGLNAVEDKVIDAVGKRRSRKASSQSTTAPAAGEEVQKTEDAAPAPKPRGRGRGKNKPVTETTLGGDSGSGLK